MFAIIKNDDKKIIIPIDNTENQGKLQKLKKHDNLLKIIVNNDCAIVPNFISTFYEFISDRSNDDFKNLMVLDYDITKISKDEIHEIINKYKNIYAMSWNVQWEALDGEKRNCIVNNINVCSKNIAKIIQIIIDEDYDFILLQEITHKQWEKLNINININQYHIIYNDNFTPAGIITIINKKYTLQNQTIIRDDLGNHDRRPFTIIPLNDNIILINVHCPHNNNKQTYEKAFDILKTKINTIKSINKDTKFIIGGDFNIDNSSLNPFDLLKKMKINNINTINFNINDETLNTCCDTSMNRPFDHIYSNFTYLNYNKDLTNNIYKLYYKNKSPIFSSDHLPIFSSDHLPIFSYGII
jgi:hypothetical protein